MHRRMHRGRCTGGTEVKKEGGAQHTCSEATEAGAEAGPVAAAVEMAVTKEGMARASSSLGRQAPGPAPHLTQ